MRLQLPSVFLGSCQAIQSGEEACFVGVEKCAETPTVVDHVINPCPKVVFSWGGGGWL